MSKPLQSVAHIVTRNSAFGLAAQLTIKLLSFAFSVLIVRHLGADSYGQYSAVLAFGGLFVFIGDLGLSQYAVRQVARWRDAEAGPERIDALFGSVLVLRLVLSVLAAVLLVAAAWLTGRPPVMVGAIALGTLGLVMYAVQGTSDGILAGFERLDLTAVARVLNQLTFVVAGGAALWLGAGYYGLVGANLAAVVLMTIFCWWAVRWLGVRPRGALARTWPDLLRRSAPFGVIGFTLGISYRFDVVLLNIFRGDAETGYYTAAYNLVFAAALLSNVLNTALFPSLTRLAASAPEHLPRVYQRTLRYLLVLALPITLGGTALADQLIPALFTAAYEPATLALRVLIWATPLMFASEFLGYVVVIQGHERRVARAIVLSTALNATCNLLLVPRFGFVSAAVLTVMTEAVLVGQYVWLLRTVLQRIDLRMVIVRPLLAGLGMLTVLVCVHGAPLLLSFAAGALSYISMVLMLGVVGPDEAQFARDVWRRIVGLQHVAERAPAA
jgi:O-antigen/teichoic acid export membrane protein